MRKGHFARTIQLIRILHKIREQMSAFAKGCQVFLEHSVAEIIQGVNANITNPVLSSLVLMWKFFVAFVCDLSAYSVSRTSG